MSPVKNRKEFASHLKLNAYRAKPDHRSKSIASFRSRGCISLMPHNISVNQIRQFPNIKFGAKLEKLEFGPKLKAINNSNDLLSQLLPKNEFVVPK